MHQRTRDAKREKRKRRAFIEALFRALGLYEYEVQSVLFSTSESFV